MIIEFKYLDPVLKRKVWKIPRGLTHFSLDLMVFHNLFVSRGYVPFYKDKNVKLEENKNSEHMGAIKAWPEWPKRILVC